MKKKIMIKRFSVLSFEKEQNYLRSMHNSGWKFIKISCSCIYHFEECEPEDVIYQLDYNPEGLYHKDEYIQMFKDCGWDYIQDVADYCYFKKPTSIMTNGNEEIFCDAESRLKMFKRVFKVKTIPIFLFLSVFFVPNIIINLTEPYNYKMAILYAVGTIIYIASFGRLAYKYYKFKQNNKN